jgi:DNA helicase II / ATP-dependent DNA helicase PcrA
VATEAAREPDPGKAWRIDLNGEQLAAATHEATPLLIVAGAGTGKTSTLSCRVAHFIESGTPPQRILLLTFSRRAAREMLGRVEGVVGASAQRVWGGTFHAVASRLLRLHGRAIGVQPDFTILDQADMADLLDFIRAELGYEQRDRRFPRKATLEAIYSRTVNAQQPLTQVVERHYPWCGDEVAAIGSIFTLYTTRKRAQNVLDYDDLLLYWKALAGAEPAGRRMAERFDHVLVDEYQDTNALQAQILLQLHRHVSSITVVGDDAQAIYSFRAATVDNILSFASVVPRVNTVTLEQNYRSTSPLLAASNAVIALSPQRHKKTLWSARAGATRPALITCHDEADQANLLCDSILRSREQGTLLREQATLFRASHHSDLLEVELSRRNIPFVKYGGLRFLEAAHVKDVLAILRIFENPFDEVCWFRVLQLFEGVGPAAARSVIGQLGVQPKGATSPLEALVSLSADLPEPALSELAGFRDLVTDCVSPGAQLPAAVEIERVRRFCRPLFERKYRSVDSRLADIEQLEVLAAQSPSRSAFLSDITLDPPSSTADIAGPPLLDEDYVILSTIHSAKGGEWDVVRIIHAADGMIPSDMSTGDAATIEEERRLLYVAMTRARDTLEIYFPLRYYRRPRGRDDAHGYAQLTRFIPEEIRQHFDSTTVDERMPDDAEHVGGRSGREAVDTLLQKLW